MSSIVFEKTPCVSLGCKLVPVQYREYKYMVYCCLNLVLRALGTRLLLPLKTA